MQMGITHSISPQECQELVRLGSFHHAPLFDAAWDKVFTKARCDNGYLSFCKSLGSHLETRARNVLASITIIHQKTWLPPITLISPASTSFLPCCWLPTILSSQLRTDAAKTQFFKQLHDIWHYTNTNLAVVRRLRQLHISVQRSQCYFPNHKETLPLVSSLDIRDPSKCVCVLDMWGVSMGK